MATTTPVPTPVPPKYLVTTTRRGPYVFSTDGVRSAAARRASSDADANETTQSPDQHPIPNGVYPEKWPSSFKMAMTTADSHDAT